MVLLVERAPVAAVDEHQTGAVALGRREQVELLPRHLAVGQVELRAQRAARVRRRLGPAREELRVIGNQLAVVVELAEGRALRSVHPRFSLNRPMASWPGRSENENSTVSLRASSSSGIHDGTTKMSRGSKSKLCPAIFARPPPSIAQYTVPSVER